MLPIEFFRRAARRTPDNPALIDGRETVTFAALAARVDALSAGFAALDPTPGSRVAICAGNSIDHVVALLATLAAGKVWVPLNPRNGAGELNGIVDFTEPSILVVDSANADRLNLENRVVVMSDRAAAGARSQAAIEAAHAGARQVHFDLPLDHTQAIKFTGGTTGAPKGVMQPYRAWNTNIATQTLCYGLTEADRYLVVAPVTHGTSTYLLPILGAGGCLVFPNSVKPAGILEAIEEHAITMLFMPPTLMYALMAEQGSSPRDLGSLRYAIYGAAPMRPEKIAEARELFGNVIATTYGQTEAPQIATFMAPEHFRSERNLASVGRPTILTDVAILDQDGRRLPPGEMGEICIRGDLVMTGYWRMPEKTAETIRHGWLYTGDLGVMDERGFLFLKDRSRDVIITGGFNVYPTDVENVLGRHPAVYDCSVVGIDDEKWGEAVHAAIQPRPGFEIDPEDIIGFVKSELGSVKTPKVVHLFQNLPRSPVGKILKNDVKKAIVQRVTSTT